MSFLFGGASKEQKEATKAETALSQAEIPAVQAATEGGKALLPKSTSALEQLLSVLMPEATGKNRQAVLEGTPEVGSIIAQYDTARKAASQFSPRGGGTASTLVQEPYKLADTITQLLQKERLSARGEAENLAFSEGSLAASLLGAARGSTSDLASQANFLKQQQQQAQQQAGQAAAIALMAAAA